MMTSLISWSGTGGLVVPSVRNDLHVRDDSCSLHVASLRVLNNICIIQR